MSIGITELMVVFVVALLVIGPDKLPQYAKKFGEAMAAFRSASDEATKEIKKNIVEPLEEAQRPLREAMEPVEELNRAVKGNLKDVRASLNGIGRKKPGKESPPEAASNAPEAGQDAVEAVTDAPEVPEVKKDAVETAAPEPPEAATNAPEAAEQTEATELQEGMAS